MVYYHRIHIGKVKEVVWMKNDKVVGLDGIPNEVWKFMREQYLFGTLWPCSRGDYEFPIFGFEYNFENKTCSCKMGLSLFFYLI